MAEVARRGGRDGGRDLGDTSGAFALMNGAKDAALAVTLAPGNYSAVVAGRGGDSGVVLVEVCKVP